MTKFKAYEMYVNFSFIKIILTKLIGTNEVKNQVKIFRKLFLQQRKKIEIF